MSATKTENVRSAGVTAVSQSLSAASNFVIVVALGRYSGARAVGEFAVAFAVYTAFLGIQRAALTSPLLARAEGSTADLADEKSRAVTCSLLLSVPASLILLPVGLAVAYPPIWLLGLVLPGVLAQDAFRYLLFRSRRPSGAALLDAVWVVGSCISFFVLRSRPTSATAILLWGVSGLLAALLGMALVSLPTGSVRTAYRWWRTSLWPSGRWLTIEAGFYNVDLQIQAFGFTAVAGAAAFGTLQVASSLVGVAFFLTAGVNMALITHFARQDKPQRRDTLLASGVNFTTIAVVTLVLMAASSLVVHLIYGHRLAVPPSLILPVGLYSALIGASGAPYMHLMARHAEKTIPIARSALLIFAPVAVIVSRHDFRLALWVLCFSAAVQAAILSYSAFRRRPELVPA
jgi:O-antigen/teichoic acid export membrane protein